jgi:cyclopropane-fatty-acyl-phospholipid synthase
VRAALNLVDRGLVPDTLIRAGIRRLLRERLRKEDCGDRLSQRFAVQRMLSVMRESPIAVDTDRANEQHYEVPAEFFRKVLGARLKYSSAYWPDGVDDLDAAEEAMLELTCRRAGIKDGMDVLDLGCGWGSLGLWIAEHFPACRVLAVSNSNSQRHFIENQARRRGLGNIRVVTADMNDFSAKRRFDRVISIEMFEHMRNVEALLDRIATWLKADGRLFVHVFCHREYSYFFEVNGDNDWMARHFFTGGYMPSPKLFLDLQSDLVVENHWRVNGRHYEKTLLAWLSRLDSSRGEALEIFRGVYGERNAATWLRRWRVFFLACAELFGYDEGREWWVSHFLFRPRLAARETA